MVQKTVEKARGLPSYSFGEPAFLVVFFGKTINIFSLEQNGSSSRARLGEVRNKSMKLRNLNLKGKTCCQFPADAGFSSDRALVTAGMLRDTIK
jgi:hypothetical protein